MEQSKLLEAIKNQVPIIDGNETINWKIVMATGLPPNYEPFNTWIISCQNRTNDFYECPKIEVPIGYELERGRGSCLEKQGRRTVWCWVLNKI